MYYDKRNRDNIAKLADNTKLATMKWYEYCVENQIEILIYETIRTLAQQKINVANGKSQTLKSYHLVGQALDFVPVDSKTGATLWNGYGTPSIKKAVAKAKSLGFEWGGDWSSFVDKPHLQYNYKGYGKDTFGKLNISVEDKGELTMTQYTELKAEIEALKKQVTMPERAVSATHKTAWEWAKKEGLVDGSNPQNYVTREQMATILHRYHNKYVNKK